MKPSEELRELELKMRKNSVSVPRITSLLIDRIGNILDEQHERLEKLEGKP